MRLATGAAAFVGGVAAAFAIPGSLSDGPAFFTVAAIALAAAMLAIHRKSKGASVVPALIVLIFLLGFARAASADDSFSEWNGVPADGERAVFTGWLTDDAGPAANGARLHLNIESIRYEDGSETPASFPLTVFTPGLIDSISGDRASDGFRYGDTYEVQGEFLPSSGEFAGDSAGVVFTGYVTLTGADRGNSVRRWVAGARESISNGADSALSEPAASLAAAMVVGDRTGLPETLTEDFRGSGTSHVLAISGMHLALVGGLALLASAALFGRRRQLYLSAPSLTVWLYAALAGFSPSVTRAAIMFSVYLLARLLGRQRSVLPALGFAAALMVAASPEIVRSISFQLSFAAMAGIAIITPRLMAGWTELRARIGRPTAEGRSASPVATAVAVSIAATIATWPLVAVNFGSAPVWGGIATLLIAPALPLFVVFGGIAAILASISPAAGEIAGWPAWALAEYMNGVASLFADLPPGQVETAGWGGFAAAMCYVALFAALQWRRVGQLLRSVPAVLSHIIPIDSRGQLRRAPTWSLIAVTVIAAIAWSGAISANSGGDLKVTFFQTDRGDMVLVQTPNGNTALIDGSRHPLGAVRALDNTLPFWDRSLDALILTHPDADHVGGLQAVLERYYVETVIEAPTPHRSSVYDSWQDAVEAHGGAVTAAPGMIVALDDGVTLEVIFAGRPLEDASINDASIVTMLRYGDFSMLLTGDITTLSERRLINSGADLRATVMKIPHHGSATSSSLEFLQAVSPVIAIAQVGDDNTFGHPDEEILARIKSVVDEENIFITSRHGDVTVRTDGVTVAVATD